MPDPIDALILDLLTWLAMGPRPYGEMMESWRTSCPRLTVWEDALDRGFVARERTSVDGPRVTLTPTGRAFLDDHARARARAAEAIRANSRERTLGGVTLRELIDEGRR